jgi:hypothetical protein
LAATDIENRHFTALYWVLAAELNCDVLRFNETQGTALAIPDKPNVQSGLLGVIPELPGKVFDLPEPRLLEYWMIRVSHLSSIPRNANQCTHRKRFGEFEPTNLVISPVGVKYPTIVPRYPLFVN